MEIITEMQKISSTESVCIHSGPKRKLYVLVTSITHFTKTSVFFRNKREIGGSANQNADIMVDTVI